MTHAADPEADTPSDCHVVLTIPAKPEYVALSRLAVAALGGWADLQADDVADLKVVVSEACAVLLAPYVTGQDMEKSDTPALELAFDLCDDRWVVKVTTLGAPPVDAVDDSSTRSDEDAAEPHDLGLAVMRALVDDVDLAGEERHPSALTFTKTVR
jgi:serine/threonine-protein kinase RsbW